MYPSKDYIRIRITPLKGGYRASIGKRTEWGATADEALGALIRTELHLGVKVLWFDEVRRVLLDDGLCETDQHFCQGLGSAADLSGES